MHKITKEKTFLWPLIQRVFLWKFLHCFYCMQEVIIFEPTFNCRCDVAGDNGNAFMSILHCCPKTGFCFQFVISLELWVELLERDSQPPRTKPTIKIKEKVQTGSFNKEDITVKSVVRLRATSQYCHAMLVF